MAQVGRNKGFRGGIMYSKPFMTVAALVFSASLACADEAGSKNLVPSGFKGSSVRTITPIYGQLLMFSLPKGFVPVFQDANGGQYIQESILKGETVETWSQMITITGAKDLAANPNVTPQLFAASMAGGFKRSCPKSFSSVGLGPMKISGFDAFAAILSCGIAVPTGKQYSESMVMIVVRGESDYYTLQWAERGNASVSPIELDDTKWSERLNMLAPELCPIVPGEPAPYPSCVNRTYI
jgi:hypothetical protein